MNHGFERASIAALLAAAIAGYGQEFPGRVQGVVTDPGEASVAGGRVTLVNVKTQVSTIRDTNERGSYLFDFVEPGVYAVTVEMQGFTERMRLGLRMEAYNATNSIMWGNPNTSVTSALFGRVTTQSNTGREMRYALRLHF